MSYNPSLPPHPLDPATIDPAFAALSEREKRDAWWKGTGDPEAERAGDDVNYAYDDMFIEGLNSRNRTDQQWAEVAYYLATGATLTDVAHYFGMARSTIWRAIQRSPGLRRRIVAEREMLRRETDSRFVALRQSVVEGLYQAINAGNIRAILWAANRLELGGPLLRGEEAPVEKEFRPIRRPIPRPARIARCQKKAPPPDAIPAPLPGEGLPPMPAFLSDPVMQPMATVMASPMAETLAQTMAPPATPPHPAHAPSRSMVDGGGNDPTEGAAPVPPTASPAADPCPLSAPAAPAAQVAGEVSDQPPPPPAGGKPRRPVRQLCLRIRRPLVLADKLAGTLNPFPSAAHVRLTPPLKRDGGEELNVWRPATRRFR